MAVDCVSPTSYPPRESIQKILGLGGDELFVETMLIAAFRAATPREALPQGISRELEIATLMVLHDAAFTDAQLEWLQAACSLLQQDQPLPLSNGLFALACSRPELAGHIDLSTRMGRTDLLNWWMLKGRAEDTMPPMLPPDCYASLAVRSQDDLPLPLTRGLEALWLAIPNLHSTIDLSTREGRCGLVAWWLLEGRKLPCGADLVPVQFCQASSPFIGQDQPLLITRGLHALALALPELQSSVELATPIGRAKLIGWWMIKGRRQDDFTGLVDAQTYAQIAPSMEQDQPLLITRGLHALALALPELQSSVDLATAIGRAKLIDWWMTKGRTQGEFTGLVNAEIYAKASPGIEQDQPLLITRGLHALAHALPELQSSVELATPIGRAKLIDWWMLKGRTRDEFTDLVDPQTYVQISPSIEQDQPLLITRGLHALALALPELQSSLDIDLTEGRKIFVRWWMNYGCLQPAFEGLGGHEGWGESYATSDIPPTLTRGLYALWLSREDLQQSFDITTTVGRQAILDWYLAWGECFLDRSIPNKMAGAIEGYAGVSDTQGTFGINILGYGRGEFGIGEDVRMALAACQAARLDACLPRLPLRISARQSDLSVAWAETVKPVYDINLICMPFFETLRLLGKTRGSILDCRYNIAFWQWELARFPQSMACAIDLVDEIWASSEFTASAMRAATEKSVIRMPMVVCLPEKQGHWLRENFGLCKNTFVFLTVLDGASSVKRKNPLAVVHAFLAAFPSSSHVNLVLKAMNVSVAQSEWSLIVEYATKDKRIKIIAETMTKDKLLGLQAVCDCFVSLHRSEGFGRNIAEAMLLGKPVIVSDYSGNTDFTTADNAFLVSGSELVVTKNDYPFSEGQVWFNPDVSLAADLMQKCIDDHFLRNKLSQAGRLFVDENYSKDVVGVKYIERLNFIFHKS